MRKRRSVVDSIDHLPSVKFINTMKDPVSWKRGCVIRPNQNPEVRPNQNALKGKIRIQIRMRQDRIRMR
jgi:hypothetical protein